MTFGRFAQISLRNFHNSVSCFLRGKAKVMWEIVFGYGARRGRSEQTKELMVFGFCLLNRKL